MTLDRAVHGQYQMLLVDRFWQKVDRPILHRFDSHRNIAVTCHEHDRQIRVNLV